MSSISDSPDGDAKTHRREHSGEEREGQTLGAPPQHLPPAPGPNIPNTLSEQPPAPGGDEVLGDLRTVSHRKDQPGSSSSSPSPAQVPTNAPASPEPGADLGGLLGSILGAGGAVNTGTTGGQGDLGGLLGAILGGGAAAQPSGGAGTGAGDDVLGGLLGSILGGGQTGMGNAGAMGGMGSTGGLEGALQPLANALASRMHIPPEVAMVALSLLVPMLLQKVAGGGQQQVTMQGMQGLTIAPHEEEQLVHHLRQQTGMDQLQAKDTIQTALRLISGQ